MCTIDEVFVYIEVRYNITTLADVNPPWKNISLERQWYAMIPSLFQNQRLNSHMISGKVFVDCKCTFATVYMIQKYKANSISTVKYNCHVMFVIYK
jgi:hypothetical protein